MDYLALKAEITADPAALGYAGKTDEQVAALMNNAALRSVNRAFVSSADIFEAIDPAEYQALSAANKAAVNLILGLGDRVPVNGTNTKAVLFAAFGSLSITRPALIALAKEAMPRGRELGMGEIVPSDVMRARVA